ncbi:invasion associated locus B family protein [Rhizobiaceae bacterium]|nr:invasion associated locus B family protein [Rhizobiaceae bacterium]
MRAALMLMAASAAVTLAAGSASAQEAARSGAGAGGGDDISPSPASRVVRATTTSKYPQPERRRIFADWVEECYGQAPVQRCQLFHRVLMDQGTTVALVATFAYLPDATSLELQIAVPLGVDLSAGATLAIGSDFSTPMPLTRCTQQGCLIEGTLGTSLLQRLLTAEVDAAPVTVTVTNPSSGPFSVPLSLAGFGEAHAEIAPPAALAALEPSKPDVPVVKEPADGTRSGGTIQLEASPEEKPDNRLAPVTGETAPAE